MNMMKSLIAVYFLIVIGLINVGQVFPQDALSSEIMDPELEQEFKWLKAETFVITASKVKENIKKAPASITVVTDKQIRQMGATSLVDVLRAVPGFGRLEIQYNKIGFLVRGSLSGANSNGILLLINNHPVNEGGLGGFTWVHDTLIIDNIKRIEFVRGPGSALYGANAFVGVINVITKEAKDIDGFELTARGGSWDTQQYNLLFGKTFSDLEVAFNLNYFKTHGYRAFIEEDFQTQINRLTVPFGFAPASLAPGRTSADDEKYDSSLNLKYKGFTLDGRYVDRESDLPVNQGYFLTQKAISTDKDYYLNLSYEKSIWEGLDLFGKVYRNVKDSTEDHQWRPPGVVVLTPDPPGFAILAEGLLSEDSGKASRTGIDIQATYKISDSNTIVAGATYEEQKTYDKSVKANFLPTDDPNVIIPLPSVQKWPDYLVADSEKRNFKAVFLEDIWDITDDIRLTTGVRYDRYSDFGSEVSPRIGLTWEYIDGYDLKLLYGHAFRAPTFGEIGFRDPSSELDPETNDTYEVSLGAEFTSSFNCRITYYYRKREDIILPNLFEPPWNYKNKGKQRDQGFEVEAKYDFGRGTYISGYYNYQSFKDGSTLHGGDFMANIRVSRYLNFNVDCNFADGTERFIQGDTRDDPSSVTLVNTTLIAKKFLKGYEGFTLRGSVYNLLDKDWSAPMPPQLPDDLPMPGINFLFEMKYSF